MIVGCAVDCSFRLLCGWIGVLLVIDLSRIVAWLGYAAHAGRVPVRIWLTSEDVIALKAAAYRAGVLSDAPGARARISGVPITLATDAAVSRVVFKDGSSVPWRDVVWG